MAPKRSRKKKTTIDNKRLRTEFVLKECLTEFNLIDDDTEYFYFEFNFKKSICQENPKEEFPDRVQLFNQKFEIVDFKDLDTSKDDCVYIIFLSSNNDLFLLYSGNDTRICFALSWVGTNNCSYDYEQTVHLFKALRNKKLLIVDGFIEKTGSTSNYLSLNILLYREAIFQNIASLNEKILLKNDTILSLMSFFYGYPHYASSSFHAIQENSSIDQFYSSIYHNKQKNEFESICLSKLDFLIPTLRPYQESAVKWMLNRENHNKLHDHQILFVKHKFANVELYYHKLLGHFITDVVYDNYIENFKPSSGGILADEMGLGKTIETLALILYNRKENVQLKFNFFNQSNLFSFSENPLFGTLQCNCGNIDNISVIENKSIDSLVNNCLCQNYYLNENLIKCLLCGNYQHIECSCYQIDEDDFPYLCSRCWPKIDLIDSACTLIVCPKSILQQWVDEIEKHLSNVKVFIYNGIRSKRYIFPPNLAKNDIVITTYDILRSEIAFTSSFEYGHLRSSKKYYSQISPMLSINWWRLCFDEAQLVEGTFTRAAQMASLLNSTYRWAITGTPIQQSVNDIFGLLYFIQEEPFCHKVIWNYALFYPYCQGNVKPLVEAVTNCFWRTPKNEVIDEIGILKPIYCVNELEFSQIERDFYLRQVYSCKNCVNLQLEKVDKNTKLSDLSSHMHSTLLNIALKLRQTCCHPMVVNSPLTSVKHFVSLQDVLVKMIEDTKYDCEKDHREIISSMNGTSSIYIQKNDFRLAIDSYKSALSSILKYEEYFRTDKTQKYHIYYNLAEIVELFGYTQIDCNNMIFLAFNGVQLKKSDLDFETIDQSNFDLAEEDKKLRMNAKQIYENYLLSDKLACITTEKYRLELINKCNDLQKRFVLLNERWFIPVLTTLSSIVDINEIDLFLSQPHGMDLTFEANSCPTIDSIKMTLDLRLSKIENGRKNMIKIFEGLLEQIISYGSVENYINCHIKKNKNKPNKCTLCVAELKFIDYEKNLFNVQYNLITEDAEETDINIRQGNWNESAFIVTLRRLAQLYKSKAQGAVDFEFIVTEMDNFFQYIDEIKKEFKTHRKYWTNLSEFILRIDELNQAQTRYVSTLDGENIDDLEEKLKSKMENDLIQFAVDKNNGERKLGSDLDRLRYLINLKNSLKDKDNIESRMCSICWCNLTKYYILTCGHFFCVSCTLELEKLSHCEQIKCSVCRAISRKNALCCIDDAMEEKIKVKGDWSTKIVHIIRCVIRILQSNEKILIFSSWILMLEIMRDALQMNQVNSFVLTASDRNFFSKIKIFQNSQTDNVLLLPINFACNGLNLVEASHVIFINSSLNKADELQAIGRIYRIGQNRQTYVHKFIINDSIEELIENHHQNVYHRHRNKNSEFNNLTVREFFNLFD